MAVKDRVRMIYDQYPKTINHDEKLLEIYEQIFGSCKYKESTIKRAGRFWRSKDYKRHEDIVRENMMQEKAIRGVY
jgi:hypothetical protein